MRLSEKTALITGGTSGIGLATARRFLKEGFKVAVTGRDKSRFAAVQEELGDGALVLGRRRAFARRDEQRARERTELHFLAALIIVLRKRGLLLSQRHSRRSTSVNMTTSWTSASKA